ncbi:hypothetical protein [Streptomyces sp. NPDC091215]|uniref:hypothetical protein n=1 Tax=Streptomyces sp. NPDC091215 TaxID=3155192 RepID=UPI0034376C0E
MFAATERERVRERLLARAETDGTVTGAAFTGSLAVGAGDRWSDIDLVLAVRGEPTATADRWTRWLYDELDVRHHWELPAGGTVIRVFLLPGWLEIDLTFAPETEFGPRGPQWRTLFGEPRPLDPFAAPDPGTLAGLVWHHALHARVSMERGRRWQAEHWISAIRDHTITLACLRLGHATAYAKGAHLLPEELTARLESTLVRSLTEPELRRALTATAALAMDEVARFDPRLAARLRPMLEELTTESGEGRSAGT